MVVVLTGMCAYPEIAVTRVGTDDGFSEVYNPVCEGLGQERSRHVMDTWRGGDTRTGRRGLAPGVPCQISDITIWSFRGKS